MPMETCGKSRSSGAETCPPHRKRHLRPAEWAKRGVAKVSNELQKTKNALVPNCMKAFAGTFGSPAIMALGAFDPWLCVTAFRQLCPFVAKIIKQYNRTFRRLSQLL